MASRWQLYSGCMYDDGKQQAEELQRYLKREQSKFFSDITAFQRDGDFIANLPHLEFTEFPQFKRFTEATEPKVGRFQPLFDVFPDLVVSYKGQVWDKFVELIRQPHVKHVEIWTKLSSNDISVIIEHLSHIKVIYLHRCETLQLETLLAVAEAKGCKVELAIQYDSWMNVRVASKFTCVTFREVLLDEYQVSEEIFELVAKFKMDKIYLNVPVAGFVDNVPLYSSDDYKTRLNAERPANQARTLKMTKQMIEAFKTFSCRRFVLSDLVCCFDEWKDVLLSKPEIKEITLLQPVDFYAKQVVEIDEALLALPLLRSFSFEMTRSSRPFFDRHFENNRQRQSDQRERRALLIWMTTQQSSLLTIDHLVSMFSKQAGLKRVQRM